MSRRATLLLLTLAIAPYFVHLAEPDLTDANETLYAEPPREALETGEWLAPTMNYEPWFVKPPGVTWATLPFYALLGPTEFAGRLAMALAAAGTILLTWRIGARAAGTRAGVLSALVLATTAKHFLFSRQLAGDVFLTTCFTAAIWAYQRWFLSRGKDRAVLWIAAVALGAGTLMKGPVALLLPAVALPVHLGLAGRRGLWKRLRPVGPALLCLAIAAPWFAYMAWRYGREFLDVYFLEHHFARALTGRFGGGRGVLFYPTAYLGDALPWSVALPGAIWAGIATKRWRREPWLISLVWCAVVFGLFSLSTGKRTVYLLPVYPFASLLIGATVDSLAREPGGWRRARWIVGPQLPLALAVSFAAEWFGTRLPGLLAASLGFALLGCLWALALLVRFRRRDAAGAVLATSAAMLAGALLVALSLSAVQKTRPAREFAEFVNAHAAPGDRTGRYFVGLQSLTFYGRRPYFSLRDPAKLRRICQTAPRTWVVLPEERLADLFPAPGLRIETVLRRRYLQISMRGFRGQKPLMRTLLLLKVTPRR